MLKATAKANNPPCDNVLRQRELAAVPIDASLFEDSPDVLVVVADVGDEGPQKFQGGAELSQRYGIVDDKIQSVRHAEHYATLFEHVFGSCLEVGAVVNRASKDKQLHTRPFAESIKLAIEMS